MKKSKISSQKIELANTKQALEYAQLARDAAERALDEMKNSRQAENNKTRLALINQLIRALETHSNLMEGVYIIADNMNLKV